MEIKWPHRRTMLSILPKGSCGAELGVLYGQFSVQILTVVQPIILHLVDAWCPIPRNESPWKQEQFDAVFASVQQRFMDEIQAKQIKLHRASTDEAAAQFGTDELDWVYVDAGHMYPEASHDLWAYWPKIKPGGFLTGHDYKKNDPRGRGVFAAVQNFLRNHPEAVPIGRTGEKSPSFVIRKESSA